MFLLRPRGAQKGLLGPFGPGPKRAMDPKGESIRIGLNKFCSVTKQKKLTNEKNIEHSENLGFPMEQLHPA